MRERSLLSKKTRRFLGIFRLRNLLLFLLLFFFGTSISRRGKFQTPVNCQLFALPENGALGIAKLRTVAHSKHTLNLIYPFLPVYLILYVELFFWRCANLFPGILRKNQHRLLFPLLFFRHQRLHRSVKSSSNAKCHSVFQPRPP